ncbi:hypothetical protein BDZ89DRAFT_1035756 [Hymenopellis radicata]|nr:hypothetical protein BDZ89DRAFT_1035756 [Hymenopellis radicata]
MSVHDGTTGFTIFLISDTLTDLCTCCNTQSTELGLLDDYAATDTLRRGTRAHHVITNLLRAAFFYCRDAFDHNILDFYKREAREHRVQDDTEVGQGQADSDSGDEESDEEMSEESNDDKEASEDEEAGKDEEMSVHPVNELEGNENVLTVTGRAAFTINNYA